jgi:prepilin-type N-terminal cleavage/methylation domain-containing protein
MKTQSGFTLVEMVVVITILGILMSMGLKIASGFQSKTALSVSYAKQTIIRDALTAYLLRNGRLPCPANPNIITGQEDGSNGSCNISNGIIPFETLGRPIEFALDGWDRFYTYEVSAQNCGAQSEQNFVFRYEVNVTIQTSTTPMLTYHDGAEGCITVLSNRSGVSATRTVASVIVSHGANGFGAYTLKGGRIDSSALASNPAEAANLIGAANNHIYRSENFSSDFDDLVFEIKGEDLTGPLKRDGSIRSKGSLINPPICSTPSP